MMRRRKRKQIVLAFLIVSLFTYKYVTYRKNTKPRRTFHQYFKCDSSEDQMYNISSHQVYPLGDTSEPEGTCKNMLRLHE